MLLRIFAGSITRNMKSLMLLIGVPLPWSVGSLCAISHSCGGAEKWASDFIFVRLTGLRCYDKHQLFLSAG